MENQTKRELERALLLKLRDTVNSKEEFEWVETELARLDAEPLLGGSRGALAVALPGGAP
jgi:hypothetical protein